MPLYDFYCSSCSLEFEKIVSSGVQEYHCPNCDNPAPRAHIVEQVAKPVLKGKSPDGTGKSYIEDGDYMIGINAYAANQRMEERNHQKLKIMHEHNTTALSRKDVQETEKTYTGKERTLSRTEYEPLKGEKLKGFINSHKAVGKMAEEGKVQTGE